MITALLLIFALVIEYIYDPISNMKDTLVINNIYKKYVSIIKSYISEKYILNILFPIILVIFILISTYLLEHYMHSFFSFTLNLIILVYCLKPNEYNEKMEDIKFSVEHEKDIPEDDRLKYLMASISEKKSNDDITEITNNLFYNSTRSIFTVLFWFLVLGPAGCLGYIVLDYFIYGNDIRIDQKSKKKLEIIFGLIEYIPARLSAFSFAIVGNFENSLNAWKNLKSNVDLHKENIVLVNTIGLSSFEIIGNNEQDTILENISYIQTIISRSLLAWLSFAMLLIIGGFFI
tara:strand:+ start:118 stop:987 length:870 start_codon:yes stop_codon:yes gene_type:complete